MTEAGEKPATTSIDGVNLIKKFEGLRTSAYVCPAGVLTIGYGHTGSDVFAGLKITEERAEQLLVEDLHRFERAARDLIDVSLTQHEFDAVVSFTFNTGEGSLSGSTFRRRMNNGENKAQCFREEFPKWVNGSNGPLPGLVARRDAEVALATS